MAQSQATALRFGEKVEALVIVVILPVIDNCRESWHQTGVPLAFLDYGWNLSHIAAVNAISVLARMVFSYMVVHSRADSLALLLLIAVAATCVPQYMNPSSQFATYLGFGSSSAVFLPFLHRSLAFKRFGSDPVRYRRALRVLTLSDVLGYTIGSVVGGLTYSNGGWPSCTAMQLVLASAQTVLLALLPVMHEAATDDVRALIRWIRARRRGHRHERAGARVSVEPPVLSSEPVAAKPVAANEEATDAHHEEDPAKIPSQPEEGPSEIPLWKLEQWPCIVVVWVAALCNVLAYGFEWKVFSLYFREIYDWNPTWIGIGQGAGDFIAGLLLLAMALRRGDSENDSVPAILRCCLPLPFNVSALQLVYCGLFMLMAAPYFVLSVLGQIFIGTVYVLTSQALQEMAAIYSRGDQTLYRKLAFLDAQAYNTGNFIASSSGVPLYMLNRRLPFYLAAATVVCGNLLFTIFFCYRLGGTRTTTIKFGGLAAAEDALKKRRVQSLEKIATQLTTAW